MPLYPDQLGTMMQQPLGAAQQNQGANQMMGLPTTPEIQQYENLIRMLPRLPLDAAERAQVVNIIQNVLRRMPAGSVF